MPPFVYINQPPRARVEAFEYVRTFYTPSSGPHMWVDHSTCVTRTNDEQGSAQNVTKIVCCLMCAPYIYTKKGAQPLNFTLAYSDDEMCFCIGIDDETLNDTWLALIL